MDEINADVVIREILKEKDECNVLDLNKWKENFNKINPDVYVDICKDTILWAIEMNPDEFYYGGDKDKGGITILRQEVMVCPVCGEKHRKYPNTEAFEILQKIKTHLDKMFNR